MKREKYTQSVFPCYFEVYNIMENKQTCAHDLASFNR